MKPLAPNSLIQNRYLVVHLIGKGGMGEVYLAVDQRLGSAVALKRTFFADDEMLGNAFEREARILARLRHPVLPKVSDHFMENGEQYLVMEHIAGDDLSKRLESAQKAFPLSWVLFWADQLLDALAYLHSHEPPIIHRDIKPQNLKLTDENHIVLLDFGLSKNTTGQTRASSGGSTGSVVGYTPHYAPMEQIRGTGTNPRSDIYSLSATLYQLMSNVVPADALTRADALLNGSPDSIQPLDELNPEVSREVSTVILKGMEVSQEKRFPDAKTMQKALRKAYSEMQEAMSAQTIMFEAPGQLSSKIEQPVGIEHTPEPVIDAHDSEATRIKSEPANPVPAAASQNFEETVRYDGPIDSLSQRQADIRTEVYDAASSPFRAEIPAPPVEPVVSEPASPAPDEWAVAPSTGNGGYVPDPTVANIAFDAATPGSPYGSTANYSPHAEQATEDPYATRVPTPTPSQQFVAQTPQVQAAPKKGSSKVFIVVGVLAVLAVVGIGMAVGGWFVYSNYYAAAEPTPTPSPAPTLEITPTPAPTLEAITNSESNTTTAQSNSSSNSNVFVEPTPEPTTEARDETPNPRNTPQIEARKTPGKTSQPNGKPTPKSNTPNRTVILQ